jgi:hypothetical protein
MKMWMGILILLSASIVSAEHVVLQGSEQQQLQARAFRIDSHKLVSIEAVGIRRKFSEEMHAEAWIIQADDGQVVWRQSEQPWSAVGDDRYLVKSQGDLELPPGEYIAYLYSGGQWTMEKPFQHLGKVLRDLADIIRRDDPRHEAEYYATQCRFDMECRGNLAVLDKLPAVNGLVALTSVSNNEVQEQLLKVHQPSAIQVVAYGEKGRDEKTFWDLGWIENASTGETVWSMDSGNCADAGGAEKNVVCKGMITLQPGLYRCSYVTDSTHAWGDWNLSPPDDPRRWGIVINANDASTVDVVESGDESPTDSNLLLRWTRVGDDARLSQDLTFDQPTTIIVFAMGEGSSREMYDAGSILDLDTGRIVWEMTWDQSQPAGGVDKNRLASTELNLNAGSYRFLYHTDSSHAFGSWNGSPPHDHYHYGMTIRRLH